MSSSKVVTQTQRMLGVGYPPDLTHGESNHKGSLVLCVSVYGLWGVKGV